MTRFQYEPYARRVPALTAADTTGTYSAKVGTSCAVLRDGGQVRRGQAHPLQQHQRRLHDSLPGGIRVHGGHGRLPSPEAGACARSAWSTTAKEYAASVSWPGEAASSTWSPARSPQRRRSAAGITT